MISVMLAIVAPFGRRSSARTRARLESSRVRLWGAVLLRAAALDRPLEAKRRLMGARFSA